MVSCALKVPISKLVTATVRLFRTRKSVPQTPQMSVVGAKYNCGIRRNSSRSSIASLS